MRTHAPSVEPIGNRSSVLPPARREFFSWRPCFAAAPSTNHTRLRGSCCCWPFSLQGDRCRMLVGLPFTTCFSLIATPNHTPSLFFSFNPSPQPLAPAGLPHTNKSTPNGGAPLRCAGRSFSHFCSAVGWSLTRGWSAPETRAHPLRRHHQDK